MLNLLRTLFGFVFFIIVFGVALIKNGPKKYEVTFSLPIAHPIESYRDHIKSTVIANENAEAFPLNQDTLFALNFPKTNGVKLKESWINTAESRTLAIHQEYQFDFSRQVFFFRDPESMDRLRDQAIERLQETRDAVDKRFLAHRWNYNGTVDLPRIYYLAIEGRNEWNEVDDATSKAFEQLESFAHDNDLPLQEKRFIVYPLIEETTVQWRAAIEVDRYYRTNDKMIRCRRFKGGKSLELIHQGPLTYLNKSWKVLSDSLGNKTQAYPGIQYLTNKKVSINPLNWSTSLYLPILE